MAGTASIPETFRAEFVERTLFVAAEMDMYRLQLGGVVSFNGRVDEARLRRALRLLLDAEPVLGCRFDAESVPPVWRRLDGLDSRDLLTVRESADPAADAAAFVAVPFDPEVDAQVLGVMLRGASSDTLAVRVGHLAVDGGALKEMLYLIADIYRRLCDQPDWLPTPNLEGARYPKAKAGPLETLLSFRQSDMDEMVSRPSDWGVPLLGGRGPASYAWTSVESHVFRQAADRAKAVGGTVNDLILTAYYRTLYRLLGAGPGSQTPMVVTCELRKHLPPGTKTALSNISSAWSVSVSPQENETFDGTLARVIEATSAWKEAGAGKASAIGIPIIDRLTRRKGLDFLRKWWSKMGAKTEMDDQVGGAGITNIGVIEERLDFGPSTGVTDAWLLGPVSFIAMALTASTYRDRLHLAIGTEFDSISEELVTDALAGTAREIDAWVAEREAGVA